MDLLCFGEFGQYKGSNGKVGVIGGCFEYTGAPYYAGVSSLKSGSDLAHVFCTRSAGIPIKTYSPELIVHPTLDASDESEILDFEDYTQRIYSKSSKWFGSINVFIVGPGLGRDKFLTEHLVPKLVQEIYEKKKALIFDADGLNMIINTPNIINSGSDIILTPNKVEFGRLWERFVKTPVPLMNIQEQSVSWRRLDDSDIQPAVVLARTLGVNLLVKGQVDIATDGKSAICVGEPGSKKRVGGQGDVLCGVLASTVHQAQINGFDIVRALATASLIVRKSAFIAFNNKQRGFTTPDLIKALPTGLIQLLSNYNL